MSIALFFVTHEGIASNLLNVGEAIIQKTNTNLAYIEVPMDAPTDQIIIQAKKKISELFIDDGLFIITDIFGSTPSNIAQRIANDYKTHLLTGVNLPMIIRLLNYRNDSAEELLQKALDGAHNGIRHELSDNNTIKK